MGMFDSVWVKCPKCGTKNEFQSKSGLCILENYELENCPDDVLEDVNRHSPCICKCGTSYGVDMSTINPSVSYDNRAKTNLIIEKTDNEQQIIFGSIDSDKEMCISIEHKNQKGLSIYCSTHDLKAIIRHLKYELDRRGS